jgi:hypothetical protein
MRTKQTLVIVILWAAGILAGAARGAAPMGAPLATLGQGEWSVGIEYGREQADIDASGPVTAVFVEETSYTQNFTLSDLETNMIFGNFAYGINTNWDVFARLGVADAQDDIVAHPDRTVFLDNPIGFDGGFGFAWGVGTRATLGRHGPWSVGGLIQATWFYPGDDGVPSGPSPNVAYTLARGVVEVDYWQAQGALAAVYQTGPWRFWVGPFIQFTGGELDLNLEYSGGPAGAGGQIQSSADLDDDARVGGFLGARWEITDQWSLSVEGQVAEDSWLVGIGGVFAPGRALRQ